MHSDQFAFFYSTTLTTMYISRFKSKEVDVILYFFSCNFFPSCSLNTFWAFKDVIIALPVFLSNSNLTFKAIAPHCLATLTRSSKESGVLRF